jgi:hypothetical protein
MVVAAELDGGRIAIHVDPGRSEAWRREPYYSELKEWASLAAETMTQVVVSIGRRAIVILPDRDVDLGVVADDERIISSQSRSNGILRHDALKLKADDPRINGLEPGKIKSYRAASEDGL